jgi:hypothetical protein
MIIEHHLAQRLLIRFEIGDLAVFDIPPNLKHEGHWSFLRWFDGVRAIIFRGHRKRAGPMRGLSEHLSGRI